MARILCVEDSRGIRDIYREFLTSRGHDVDLAEDGQVGLERIQACEYDLVVTDVLMPGLGGPEMLAHATEHLQHRTPCVLEDTLRSYDLDISAAGILVDVFSVAFEVKTLRGIAGRGIFLRHDWLQREIHRFGRPLQTRGQDHPLIATTSARTPAHAPVHRAAEHTVRRVFEVAGCRAPMRFTWYPSPHSALEAVVRRPEMLHRANSVWKAWYGIGDDCHWRFSPDQARPQLVARETRAQLADDIRAAPVEPGMRATLYLALLMALREWDGNSPEANDTTGETAGAVSAWWASEVGDVILAEPPVSVHFDEHGRLHHPSEAAVLYADGFGIWALDGHRVPRTYVEAPESVPVQEILQCKVR